MLQEGTTVHIYDANKIGTTTGTLLINIEDNRWIVLTREGALLDRIIEDWQQLDPIKDEIAQTLDLEICRGMLVQVYDGELIGMTIGTLEKDLGNNRWTIATLEGYKLDRYIKLNYDVVKNDGCGYILRKEEL